MPIDIGLSNSNLGIGLFFHWGNCSSHVCIVHHSFYLRLSLKLAVEHLLWKYFYKSRGNRSCSILALEAAFNDGQGSKQSSARIWKMHSILLRLTELREGGRTRVLLCSRKQFLICKEKELNLRGKSILGASREQQSFRKRKFCSCSSTLWTSSSSILPFDATWLLASHKMVATTLAACNSNWNMLQWSYRVKRKKKSHPYQFSWWYFI